MTTDVGTSIDRDKSYKAEWRLDRILDTQGDGSGSHEMAVAGKAVTGATSDGTAITVAATAHGYSDGDIVTIAGVAGAVEANGVYMVADKTTDAFVLNTTDGDPYGATITAYSGPGVAYPVMAVKPGAGENFHIERMNLIAGDATAPTSGTYLGIAALTNGIVVEVRNAAGLLHTLTAIPVKSWADWGLNAGSDIPVSDGVGGNTDAVVRWTFSKGSGFKLLLNGDEGEYLCIRATDTLAALVYQRAAVQGTI